VTDPAGPAPRRPAKAPDAMRTIGEMAAELGIGQHVLRYWETRFPQLRPLQRAGGRRHYRAADAALVRRIHRLLHQEGYSVRGVQQLLAMRTPAEPASPALPETAAPIAVAAPAPAVAPAAAPSVAATLSGSVRDVRLGALRDRLIAALDDPATT
jgi:DNA-binding transcriptional MerR regulator